MKAREVCQQKDLATTVATGRMPAAVQQIGTFAVEAALYEAACAPAPGLVDRFNQGGCVRSMTEYSWPPGIWRRCAERR